MPPLPPLPPVVELVVEVELVVLPVEPPAPPVVALDVVPAAVLVVGLGVVSSELHPPNATRAAAVDDRRTIEAYFMVRPFCESRLTRWLQGRPE